MLEKIGLFFLSGVFFLAFVVFSYLVKEDIFTRFDFDLMVKIQDRIPRSIDPFFSSFSLVGSFELTTLILFLIVIFKRRLWSVFVIFVFAVAHIIEIIFKALLDHPGPPFMFYRYQFDFVFPSSYVKPGGAYPSGHMMRTTFLSTIFLLMILKSKTSFWKKIIGVCFILVVDVIMMVSRVSLGEHWMSDVVGGAILGVSGGLFSALFLIKR